ncbi:hypothetical protein HHI36_009021 [Cryptolaemus montrouzieri]|uniref:Uncharacterized protein n=1 Tax=Cryptolaemus montrouzieri TaxID=559131 RepID=A0ABD2MV09_9CUCU
MPYLIGFDYQSRSRASFNVVGAGRRIAVRINKLLSTKLRTKHDQLGTSAAHSAILFPQCGSDSRSGFSD